MATILEVKNVVAGYNAGPDILQDISLNVEAGQTYCIIGPNGAGKSTLLRVISGLLPPRQGKVTYLGEEISHLRADQILKKGICFVPQDRSLFPDMSVRENLEMGGYVLNDRKLIEERIDEVYAMFPILKERRRQTAKTLSGGQQQMLAIGRVLVLKPRLIMLDEPSLGLAPKIARQIFDNIRALKAAGLTVLLVEQNARMGLETSDWGVVLDLGTNSFDAPAEVVLSDPRIQELYLGRAPRLRQAASERQA
ncbi:MAG TPA: ABC transporter ATP-binding protein [Anaerolineales bacterium]|nr:ABC transporter ATP-binding protein [Anaerolineales bacterium]